MFIYFFILAFEDPNGIINTLNWMWAEILTGLHTLRLIFLRFFLGVSCKLLRGGSMDAAIFPVEFSDPAAVSNLKYSGLICYQDTVL